MSMNQHWARWCFASLNKQFEDNKGTLTLISSTEDSDLINESDDFVEYTFTGPLAIENAKGEWTLFFDISFLVQATIDDKDFQKMLRLAGIIETAFIDEIGAFKYGDTAADDDTKIGCLRLVPGSGGTLITTKHLGRVSKDIKLQHTLVEGRYRIRLEE